MRNIDIYEVGMENFGPYIDPMVLEFKKDCLTLLTGPNGIGKTVSIDAIPFTFYNDTTKGAKGDELVNNVIGKNCKTWVKFTVNNKDEYIVTRYQKYTRLGNTVILNKNGKDIKKGQREVLPVIEKLICSKRAFMNTLMFGQKVKDFFTDLVDSDKKLIFREILSLEQYESFFKTTTELLKICKDEQFQIMGNINVSIELVEDAIAQIKVIQQLKNKFTEKQILDVLSIEKIIRDSKRILKEWQNKTDDLMGEDIDIQTTDKNLNKVILELNQLYDVETKEKNQVENQQSQKISEIQTKVSEAKTEVLKNSKLEYENIQSEIDKYQKKVVKLDALNKEREHDSKFKISEVNSSIKFLEQQIAKIEDNVLNQGISKCPTCFQEIDETIIKKLEGEVDVHKQQIDSDTDTIGIVITKSDREYKKYQDQHIIINNTIVEFQSKQQNLQSEIDKETFAITDKGNDLIGQVNQRAEKMIKECVDSFVIKRETLVEEKNDLVEAKDRQDKVLKELEKIKETIININSDIKQKEFQLEHIKQEKFDETQFKSYVAKKEQFELRILTDNKLIDNLKLEQKVLEFWKAAFSPSGIPSMLIDEAIPFMNEKVTYYLDKFTSGRYIVSFDTMSETKSGEYRDKVSVNVIDTHTRANNRVQLSGGQTRIIDIATILTLGDLQASIQGVSINILLFDEIFDSLDDDNIGYVSRVLNQIKKGKSIYLISHKYVDALETDQILNFQG